MLPEPNAESAERHRVGLFTPSSTEGHGILLRADALAHWRGLLPTLLVGVLYLTRLAIWSKSLLPTKGNPVPPWEAGGLEGVAGATAMTDGPHTGICGVGVAGDGKCQVFNRIRLGRRRGLH